MVFIIILIRVALLPVPSNKSSSAFNSLFVDSSVLFDDLRLRLFGCSSIVIVNCAIGFNLVPPAICPCVMDNCFK